MRQIIIWILIVVTFLSFMITSIMAEEENSLEVTSPSVYVMEYSTKNKVYSKEAEKKMYPASMTKMMSLLLVYEAISNHKLSYDDEIKCSEYAASMGGSQIYLEPNEKMPVMDLIKSVCIASANDAIVALAEAISGSESSFVEEMNKKAKQLNLHNTNFMNASGLHHKNHYSCAKDMAIIAYHLLELGGEELLEITSTYEDYIREEKENKFWLVNTNKLLRSYEGVDGLKTGFTNEAKSCICVSAKRGYTRFITVVMGANTSTERNDDVTTLLDYAFDLYDSKIIYKKNEIINTKTIPNAKPKKVDLVCEEDVSILSKKGEKVHILSSEVIWLNKPLPYKKNSRVAKLVLELSNGDKVTTYLKCNKDIKELSFYDVFKNVFYQYF